MWIILLLACGQVTSLRAPPPVPVALADKPLVRGERSTVSVRLPTNSNEVWLMVSADGRGAGPCSGAVCADILAPEFVGPDNTNANGLVHFEVDVPDQIHVHLQVAARRAGGDLVTSEVFLVRTVQEVCDNGLDDDRDGLVDCEDATCVGAAPCDEFSCDDRQDNDGDGLVDCEDDDCWGSGCSGVYSRINSGRYEAMGDYNYGYHRTSGRRSYFTNRTLALTDVQGAAREVTSMGGTSVCTWSAGEIAFRGSTRSPSPYVFVNARVTTRDLQMSSGCAIDASTVLPADMGWTGFGTFLSRGSSAASRGREIGWVMVDRTYHDHQRSTFTASPRTYSTALGGTTMFDNHLGRTWEFLTRGDLRPGAVVLHTP